ncbi:MAG: aldehyde dehydrogenase family protein [Candidatus Undinarchaeales archaeon]|jgi:1-pyrroline-5-carboxylate dehydrogenase|nr:aldehyde dehydrogenase family protein [Candidatus Undinarchaeales archaeon]MDP7493843.1 aldehyde dehydrogenase family protein [Candidatus Undinarchaeales archaeon]
MMPHISDPESIFDPAWENEQAAAESAVRDVEESFGTIHPLIIGGDRIITDRTITSLNPSNPEEIVGELCTADAEHADLAVKKAAEAFTEWRTVSPGQRATDILAIANTLRSRWPELSAGLMLEAGMSWNDAVDETADAIDRIERTGLMLLRLTEAGPEVPCSGEVEEHGLLPRGPGLMVCASSSPLADMAGMMAACIGSGNTVIIIPPSTFPVATAYFVKFVHEAGLSPGIVNLCPVADAEMGDRLMEHKGIRYIAVCGDRESAERACTHAARPTKGSRGFKRVIADIAGSTTVIVDRSADLELAAGGIVSSAFMFQGQASTSCARLIVAADVREKLVGLIVGLTTELAIGPTREAANDIGPVMSEDVLNRAIMAIETGREEGRLVIGGSRIERTGWFIEPTVFVDLPQKSTLVREGVSGPVLSIVDAKDAAEAIALANEINTGTCVVYARDRARIGSAKRELDAPVIVINRPWAEAWSDAAIKRCIMELTVTRTIEEEQ